MYYFLNPDSANCTSSPVQGEESSAASFSDIPARRHWKRPSSSSGCAGMEHPDRAFNAISIMSAKLLSYRIVRDDEGYLREEKITDPKELPNYWLYGGGIQGSIEDFPHVSTKIILGL